jgi:nicotinamidase-related amidase
MFGDYLTERNVESLILAGVTTQCCAQSTLREAVDRGYYCLTLEDCCASFAARWHDATFDIIASEGHLFGWVTSGPELLRALETAPCRASGAFGRYSPQRTVTTRASRPVVEAPEH